MKNYVSDKKYLIMFLAAITLISYFVVIGEVEENPLAVVNYRVFILIMFAILYGGLEAFIHKHNYSDPTYEFFGKFSWYHLMMLGLFILVAHPYWQLIPIALVIEDIFFFLWIKKKITEQSWIATMFGSIKIGKKFILPIAYIVGTGSTYLLTVIFPM